MSSVWEMPFFKRSQNRLAKGVLGGWQAAGTFCIWRSAGRRSRLPLQTVLSTAGFAVAQPNRVPESVAGFDVDTARANARSGKLWFNTAAYTAPATLTIGSAARNYTDLRRDNYRNINLSMSRNFAIHERWRAQLRGDEFHQRAESGCVRDAGTRRDNSIDFWSHYHAG